MGSAVIKIQDADDGQAINVDIEFNPKIDNRLHSHQFAARVVELLNDSGAAQVVSESSENKEK